MAIAFDTSGLAESDTVTVTVGSGTNRIAIFWAFDLTNTAVLTATAGGNAMTSITQFVSTGRRLAAFYIVNPSSGSTSFVVSGGSGTYATGVTTYTGAAQTAQPDTSGQVSAASSAINPSLTVGTVNSWVTVGVFESSTSNNFSSSSLTQRSYNQGSYTKWLGDSNAPQATGSFNASVSFDNNDRMWAVSVSIKPAAVISGSFFLAAGAL